MQKSTDFAQKQCKTEYLLHVFSAKSVYVSRLFRTEKNVMKQEHYMFSLKFRASSVKPQAQAEVSPEHL